jgi:hypothetical protein
MSVGDASPTDTSSAHEETGSKETPSAKKTCPFPKCTAGYGRRQELERHIRETHLPHDNYCGQPGCGWTGYRHYAHRKDKHAMAPVPEVEVYMIYDAKGLVKRLLSKEINVEQAVGEAWSFF